MQITHAEQSDKASNAIRGGAREFKTLLTGEQGSPANYKLSFVRQSGELDIPRHKHNFDQIRMCLEGEPQNYGKNKWFNAGELVYFPEGTPYGPEQSASRRLSITFQFGGVSGSGYLSSAQIGEAMEQMKAFGTFTKGVFTRTGDLGAGQRRNQDSYEAIWEHINKRKLAYPTTEYTEPVLLQPAKMDWTADPKHVGVAQKHLATFSERGCSISILKMEPNVEMTLPAAGSTQIGFVLEGDGQLDDRDLKKYTAFSLLPGETCKLQATEVLELLIVRLPAVQQH